MKKLAILCTVALIVLSSGVSIVGCQQENEGIKTYTGHGVSFDYPKDWVKVGVDDPEALWAVSFQESGAGVEPGVAVLTYHMGGMTLREFEQAKPWAPFTNANYTTPITDMTISERDAIRYRWTAELDGVPVKGDAIFITKDYEVVYYVECYSLTSEYSTSQDAFNKLLDSFEIE